MTLGSQASGHGGRSSSVILPKIKLDHRGCFVCDEFGLVVKGCPRCAFRPAPISAVRGGSQGGTDEPKGARGRDRGTHNGG